MTILDTYKTIYYQKEENLKVKRMMKDKLNITCEPSSEMFSVIHDILTKDPCIYWSSSVYNETLMNLENLFINNSATIEIDKEIIEHFLIGYNTYKQITDVINDISQLNDSNVIKNRMYRIPTYVSTVEGCLSNLFRVILLIEDFATRKDYKSIKKLGPLKDALISLGYHQLTEDINTNIRNAINHGGVIFSEEGNIIEFQYTEKGQVSVTKMMYYDLDDLIYKLYDTTSGVVLALAVIFNKYINLVNIDYKDTAYATCGLLSLKISTPGVICRNIYTSPDRSQLNIDIFIEDSGADNIRKSAILILLIVFLHLGGYQKYFISFNGKRLFVSWIRFMGCELEGLLSNRTSLEEIFDNASKRGDIIIFDPSNEEIDEQEIKYFRFPRFESDVFKIKNIQDASTCDRKRLRAHVFVGENDSREAVLAIIYEAISWLKNVRNISDAKMYKKNGEMEADALYINVYKADRRKDKELYPSNENFICFVDYNLCGTTTLEYGSVGKSLWNQLYHEKIDKTLISWRESKYLTRHVHKYSRNEPCYCGSGKKHKKCCG